MLPLSYDPSRLQSLTDKELNKLASEVLTLQQQDRQYNQLKYYKPVSDIIARIHYTDAKTIGIGGGNGAGKTDHALAEVAIRCTGQIPLALKDYPRKRIIGPIKARVVVESLTTTLENVILPKLQWWQWSGQAPWGGSQGHWGWIPRHCLIAGDWQKSWNSKTRTLRVLNRDPDKPERVLGESTIQFMSYDQDPSDFASGDYHVVLHDEPPKEAIWNESVARVMRVGGTLMLSMTWRIIRRPVDWLFDGIYDKGIAGPNKDPNVEWINIFTTDNPHLNQGEVALRASQMSDIQRQVRIYGQPIRFSNRIYPLFTDAARHWCLACGKETIQHDGACAGCKSDAVVEYNHVQVMKANPNWPIVFVIDPHPRKPHMMWWVQVLPTDDLHVIHELIAAENPEEVSRQVLEYESEIGWHSIYRLMDPNMGASPSSAKDRSLTWQTEFDQCGLRCDLADDSGVGMSRVNTYIDVDEKTGRPRLTVSPDCTTMIKQVKRYVWGEYRLEGDHDIKQKPRAKDDDGPTCLKYVLNSSPEFAQLRMAPRIINRMGMR